MTRNEPQPFEPQLNEVARSGPRVPSPLRWIVSLLVGAGGGVAIGYYGDAFVCFGMLISFAVGALSAAFGAPRRFAYGLLGVGTSIVFMLGTVAIVNDWGHDQPMGSSQTTKVLAAQVFTVLEGIPGLLGIGAAVLFSRISRRRQ